MLSKSTPGPLSPSLVRGRPQSVLRARSLSLIPLSRGLTFNVASSLRNRSKSYGSSRVCGIPNKEFRNDIGGSSYSLFVCVIKGSTADCSDFDIVNILSLRRILYQGTNSCVSDRNLLGERLVTFRDPK